MRLVAGLVAVILAAPFAARADDTAPPPAPDPKPTAPKAPTVPLRVVRVMPESNQALLFDRLKNTHVLAEVGGTVSGYQVEDITDDEVTLSIFGKQVVLAAPLRNHERARAAAPADPYSDARSADAPGTPSDPYADEPEPPRAPKSSGKPPAWAADASSEPRVVEAPGAGPAPRVVEAPGAAPAPRVAEAPRTPPDTVPRAVETPRVVSAPDEPAAPPPATSAAPVAPPKSRGAAKHTDPKRGKHDKHPASKPDDDVATQFASAATATPATKAAAGQVTLARADVDAALSDFGRLAEAIRGELTPNGVKVAGVAEGSVFERVGLRAGDTIASVNGIVPRTLDDAANIYALASSVKTMTVLIVRDGKQSALRIAIQ